MIVRTKRLILREFIHHDWGDVLAYQSNPIYLQYYPWAGRSEHNVREFINQFIKWQSEDPRTKFQFAITIPGPESLIGNCGIRRENKDATIANIGYEIAPDYWRKGYATEAALAMVAFGFKRLKLHRIWAHCLTENLASWRVLEKIGMKREGCLRETELIKGYWRNSYIYAILDHEWNSNKSLTEDIIL